jgi:hypothetical protein
MAMSAMSAPVYVQALKQALLRQEPGFVVTRKGAVSGDYLGVFRRHLVWGLLLVGGLIASFPLGHVHVAIHAWAVLSVLMCLMPVVLWAGSAMGQRRPAAAPYRFADNTVHEPGHIPPPVVVPQPQSAAVPESVR